MLFKSASTSQCLAKITKVIHSNNYYDTTQLLSFFLVSNTSGNISIESLNLVGFMSDTLSSSNLKLSTTFSPVFAEVSNKGQSHDSQYSKTSSIFTFLESSGIKSYNHNYDNNLFFSSKSPYS